MWDEDTSDERMAVSTSLTDPYLAILRDDSTLLLLRADESGDLDELEMNEEIKSLKWISCSLYFDKTGIFSRTGKPSKCLQQNEIVLFLLSQDCRLFVSHKRSSPLPYSLQAYP